MKIKIFRQGNISMFDDKFEDEVNKFCSQHNVMDISACSDSDSARLLAVVVTYCD